MSDKLKQLFKDFIFYGNGGHLTRCMEIAREILLLAEREERAQAKQAASDAPELIDA